MREVQVRRADGFETVLHLNDGEDLPVGYEQVEKPASKAKAPANKQAAPRNKSA